MTGGKKYQVRMSISDKTAAWRLTCWFKLSGHQADAQHKQDRKMHFWNKHLIRIQLKTQQQTNKVTKNFFLKLFFKFGVT